jgi:hypothetical protein
MPVTSHHDEVGRGIGGMGQNCIWHVQVSRYDVLDFHLQVMSGQMARNRSVTHFVALAVSGRPLREVLL